MQYFLKLTVIALVLSTGACRSTKKIQTAISKKDTVHAIEGIDTKADSARFIGQVYGGIQKNIIDFTTFSAKVKVDFEGKDGKKNDFNAFIRMYKDSVLWVSINAALGIEAFRILVTPDSVKVLNKLEKIAQLRSLGYIQEVAQIPLNFQELQDLIIGNPLYLDTTSISYKKDESTISLTSIGSLFKNFLTLDNRYYTLLHSKLDDVDPIRARTCDITYGDYETKYGKRFSTFRKITVIEKSKLDIELHFKQFNFNEELNYPFSVPKNYKVQ